MLSEIDDVKMEEIESREYAEKNVRVDSNIANIGRHDRRRMSESRTNSRGNISANSDTQNSSREDRKFYIIIFEFSLMNRFYWKWNGWTW